MSNPSKDEIQRLTVALANYCSEIFSVLKGKSTGHAATSELVRVFKRVLPDLALSLKNEMPEVEYTSYLVTSCVADMKNKEYSVIWQKRFHEGTPTSQLASTLAYSHRTIQRRIRDFPAKVVMELCKKDREVSAYQPIPTGAIVLAERQIDILRKTLHLSKREAEIVLEYARKEKQTGLKKIAKKLFISMNTLRSHIKMINKKTGADSIKGASATATEVLQKHGLWNKE